MFVALTLSPLPSNYLFIAYGLTSLPIMFLAVPFCIGRIFEPWFLGNDLEIGRTWIGSDLPLLSGRVLRLYQLLLVPIIHGVTRVDWALQRKFRRFDKSR